MARKCTRNPSYKCDLMIIMMMRIDYMLVGTIETGVIMKEDNKSTCLNLKNL